MLDELPIMVEVMKMINKETRKKLRELNLSAMIEEIDSLNQNPGCTALAFEDQPKIAVDYLYQKKYNSKV